MTNTLMNQSVGAHVLATSSGVRKHKASESEDSDWSDSEESQTLRDNHIRAVWSQVRDFSYTNICTHFNELLKMNIMDTLSSGFAFVFM